MIKEHLRKMIPNNGAARDSHQEDIASGTIQIGVEDFKSTHQRQEETKNHQMEEV